jgi:WD40 repeat protein
LTDRPELTLGPFGPVNSVSFDGSGARLAAGCYDGLARIWDSSTGGELGSFPHGNNVFQAVLSSDGSLLATGSSDGTVRMLDTARGTELAAVRHEGDDPVVTVAVSPDGGVVGYGTRGGTLRVLQARTGAVLNTGDRRAEIARVEFSPDGERLVAACHDGTAVVLTTRAGREPTEIKAAPFGARDWGPGPSVRAATFSPDGELVAFGGHDTNRNRGRAHVATTAGEMVAELPHDQYVSSVAFCLGGRALATAAGGLVSVFDFRLRSRSWQHRHGGVVWEIAPSPDGTMLVTACHDGTARLLDAATGEELARFRHDGPVTALAFRPDGRVVATGSWDGHARTFRVP